MTSPVIKTTAFGIVFIYRVWLESAHALSGLRAPDMRGGTSHGVHVLPDSRNRFWFSAVTTLPVQTTFLGREAAFESGQVNPCRKRADKHQEHKFACRKRPARPAAPKAKSPASTVHLLVRGEQSRLRERTQPRLTRLGWKPKREEEEQPRSPVKKGAQSDRRPREKAKKTSSSKGTSSRT